MLTAFAEAHPASKPHVQFTDPPEQNPEYVDENGPQYQEAVRASYREAYNAAQEPEWPEEDDYDTCNFCGDWAWYGCHKCDVSLCETHTVVYEIEDVTYEAANHLCNPCNKKVQIERAKTQAKENAPKK